MGEVIEAVEDEPIGALEAAPAGDATPQVTLPAREPKRSAAIIAFCSALTLGTIALLLFSALHGAAPIRTLLPQPAMTVLIFALCSVITWVPVSFHHRGNTIEFSLDDVPLLLGLVFLAPWLLILACVSANLLVLLLRRFAPLKILINLSMVAFSTAIAALVYRELIGAHSPVSPQGWAAAAIAMIALALSVYITIAVMLKLLGKTRERRTRSQFASTAMVTIASICLAIVVLNAAWISLWATVPVLMVAALIIAAYRGFTRLTLRFASLERLYEFSRATGSANLESTSMTVEVLRQVCTVMRAQRAQLILAEPSNIPRRYRWDEHGLSELEAIDLDYSSIVTQVIKSGVACLDISSNHRQRRTPRDSVLGNYAAAIVAPLVNDNLVTGAIVALDRDEELDEFDQDDLHLFEALVANASVNLQNANNVEVIKYERDANQFLATHDSDTGLPNRKLFLEHANMALRDDSRAAVFLIILDRFKDVIETHGHSTGDTLVEEVAGRIRRPFVGRGIVARIGNDEFALFINDISPEQALTIAKDLHSEISRPIEMEGPTLDVTARIGVALAPIHGDEAGQLLRRADIAMLLAKQRRSAVELYSIEHDQSMERRRMLESLLKLALQSGAELNVVYHAIADVRSRKIAQVEALTRWNHPVHGPIPPDEFIAIAEQNGLIGQITDFVLSEACKHLVQWRQEGLGIGVAVNVSGRELMDGSLVDRVSRHLLANNLPPDVLTIEVTETEVMEDLLQASRVLDELAALGVRIAIDDYGTGYSSLAYIHRLPVQELKIDRSFITNLPNELSNQIIVRSSIAMAHSLKLKVVAEGAEDEITCALLADAGCDQIQGYYLSKPMDPEDLRRWLLQGASLAFTPLTRSMEEDAPLVLS